MITGSTSGIGLSIARLLASKGYGIVLNGLHDNGTALAEELSDAFNVRSIFSSANLLKLNEIDDLVESANEVFGGVDVLVNNAGVQFVSTIEDFPVEKWDEIFGLNLRAAFYLTKKVWPMMKLNRFGRVINIASAHGLVGSPYKSAYVAAKHGLVGFTKTAALEGAAFGITVNAICPGFALTDLVESQIMEAMKKGDKSRENAVRDLISTKHAIPDFVEIDAIAQTALFLAEGVASESITGISIPVDCGWTSH